MDIALYHPWIKSKGGVERLLLEYAKNSSHDVTIFTHYKTVEFEEYSTDIEVLSDVGVPEGFVQKGITVAKAILGTNLNLEQYDVFLVSEAGLGSLITLRNHEIPTACYCHTPLRAAHQFYSYYQSQYGTVKSLIFKSTVIAYRQMEKRAWRHFQRVMCNSKKICKIINEAGLAGDAPTAIIYPGVEIEAFEKGETGDYFIYPSRFKPYKRQELAIKSFKRFQEEHPQYRLVLAGFPDDPEYLEALKEQAKGANIEFMEDVTDKEMRKLYQDSFAVLFTAKDEDWGIVPIEGMAAGKPIISVNEGGPSESIKDGETGFLVRDSPEGIAEKMGDLVEDEEQYKEMSANASKRAQQFTWSSFAEQVDEQLEELA